jgi:hypothetical protein
MKVTVSVTNFITLMYCTGAEANSERPVTVSVPQPILQAALSKTPPSDKPSSSTICSRSASFFRYILTILQ